MRTIRVGFSKLCAVLGLLLVSAPVYAATWYVAGGADIKHALGQANEASGDGSEEQPFTTITSAMRRLQPGDNVVIRSGVYRETIQIPERQWGLNITRIEGQGKVVIKGSEVVNDWQPVPDRPGLWSRSWRQEPAQVFVRERPLQQIGGTIFGGFPKVERHPLATLHAGAQKGIWPGRREGDEQSMPVGSFYFSSANQQLFVKVSPDINLNQVGVEVSVRAVLMGGRRLLGFEFSGLQFAHSNTTVTSRAAAINLSGHRMLLRDVHIREADGVGLEVVGDFNRLENVSANDCGQLGIRARGSQMVLQQVEVSRNNYRGFNKWWEAGGAKFVGDGGLQQSQLIRVKAIGNRGDGIWFDWKNRSNSVQQSLIANNDGMGLHYEASDAGVFVDNVIIGNSQRGIYLAHSSNTVVAHNLVAGNRMQGIVAIDEGREGDMAAEDGRQVFRTFGNAIWGNLVAWNGDGAIVLPTALQDNLSDANVLIGRAANNRLMQGWSSFGAATLARWRQNTGQDATSMEMLATASADDAMVKRLGAESFVSLISVPGLPSSRRTVPDLAWVMRLQASPELKGIMTSQQLARWQELRPSLVSAMQATQITNKARGVREWSAEPAILPGPRTWPGQS